ncbi:MAG: hypothetical protein JXC32_11040 [Anaerolineae bacterium]|nr:hypothetical protein [Anaerolineae bacterium]
MKTNNAETPVEDEVSEGGDQPAARPEKHWESFPQPADCSVKWDFEGLSRPPRARDRGEVVAAASSELGSRES